jgi:hypothetical protein
MLDGAGPSERSKRSRFRIKSAKRVVAIADHLRRPTREGVMATIVRLSAVLLILSVSRAHGDTTFTPPVRSDAGGTLACVAQNLADTAIDVTAQLSDGSGNVVDEKTVNVPAGTVGLITSTTATVFGGYCRFSFVGSAELIRGFSTLEDAGGSNTRVVFPSTPNSRVPGGPITTYSPPVHNHGDNLLCRVLNLTDGPVDVFSEVRNGTGGVVDSRSSTVPGGESRTLARAAAQEVVGGYCRFEFAGNPLNIRTFIEIEDAGGSPTRLLHPATTALAPAPVNTPTPTAAEPTLTVTPTAGSTPPAGCCGDCDGDGMVAINELIIAVNNSLNTCPAP